MSRIFLKKCSLRNGCWIWGSFLPQHLFDMFFLRFACWMVWKLFQTGWNEVKNRDADDFPASWDWPPTHQPSMELILHSMKSWWNPSKQDSHENVVIPRHRLQITSNNKNTPGEFDKWVLNMVVCKVHFLSMSDVLIMLTLFRGSHKGGQETFPVSTYTTGDIYFKKSATSQFKALVFFNTASLYHRTFQVPKTDVHNL